MSRASTANSRIRRMWKYTSGGDESLDTLKNALENLYGHEIIGAPVIHFSEVPKDQRDILNELVESYLSNPYSTITGYKAMINKGFREFSVSHNLSNVEVVTLNKVFKSPAWQKVREQYYGASESVVSGLQEMASAGVTSKEIINILNDFNKSPNMDKSLLTTIDKYL